MFDGTRHDKITARVYINRPSAQLHRLAGIIEISKQQVKLFSYKKDVDQSALFCVFVVRIQQKQDFSRRGPYV